MSKKIINIGDLVVCDFCNADGKYSKGGVMVGSYAVCGDCSEKNNYYDKNYENADEISEMFDRNKTFQENVLKYLNISYGTTDGIISFENFK